MKNQELNLSELAFKKMVFHALRYPSTKVYGLLTDSTSIMNAYPLFHSPPTMPVLALAMDLVQSNLSTDNKESIVGFYEFCEDPSQPTLFSRICESNQQLKNMFILKLGCVDKKFTFTIDDAKVQVPAFQVAEKDLLDGKHRLIVDIDAHLDCPELDFKNTYIQ